MTTIRTTNAVQVFCSAIMVFAVTPAASASTANNCVSTDSFSKGVMIEYQAPKGILFESVISLNANHQLKTTYTSISPGQKKLIVKYHRGLFTLASWSELSPSKKTLHTYEPAIETLTPEKTGDVIRYVQTWITSTGRKTVRDTVMKVIQERQQVVGDCTYKVLGITLNSKIRLPNGQTKFKNSSFDYIPELNFKDSALLFNSPQNITIRHLNSTDFNPGKTR